MSDSKSGGESEKQRVIGTESLRVNQFNWEIVEQSESQWVKESESWTVKGAVSEKVPESEIHIQKLQRVSQVD